MEPPTNEAEHAKWGVAVKMLVESGASPADVYKRTVVARSSWWTKNETPLPFSVVAIPANWSVLAEQVDRCTDESDDEDGAAFLIGEHEYRWSAEEQTFWHRWLDSTGRKRAVPTFEAEPALNNYAMRDATDTDEAWEARIAPPWEIGDTTPW